MEADAGASFTTNYRQQLADDGGGGAGPQQSTMLYADEVVSMQDDAKTLFKTFLTNFRIDNDYIYTDMLRANLKARLQFVEVNIDHLQKFSEALSQAVQHAPTRSLGRLETGAVEVAQELNLFAPFARKEIQVQFFWPVSPLSIRQLAHEEVARMVCISGIVIKCSPAYARCTRAVIQCTSCRSKTIIPGGKAALDLPPQCLENGPGANMAPAGSRKPCRPSPYVLIPSESDFEDSQVLKLQELPDDVPTGELPRHVTVIIDRYLVDKTPPGTRMQVAGIVSVQEKRGGGPDGSGAGKSKNSASRGTAGLRSQYLRGVGLMTIGSAGSNGVSAVSVNQNFSSRVRSRAAGAWQAEDEAQFKEFARRDVYGIMSKAIDPAVFGLVDQKKAIACLLFGGTRKRQDTNYLRGDMNVLLIGDPSTAKSQLLKFTEKIAPIGIYTSGKGSSAAGLTASVVSGGGGDFWLEAGSMVLADGGVVCIDEFDKMRDQDQVAIHEAMEQQTISIAKANLTTMLNSRTSVLAAANPNMGSYDPLKSNEEQMDFAGSILSRFDLIFKVLDPKDPTIDKRIADHVMRLHKKAGAANHTVSRLSGATAAKARTSKNPFSTQGTSSLLGGASSTGLGAASTSTLPTQNNNSTQSNNDDSDNLPVFPLPFLTKYIAYARAVCRPCISQDAMTALLDFFVQVRRDSHAQTVAAMSSGGSTAAPIIQITARQLESLVRITESLAKMRLEPLASARDAEEAIRLFKVATVDAINSGITEVPLSEAQSEVAQRIEDAVRRRVAVGSSVLYSRLGAELSRLGFEAKLIDRALYVMIKREELEYRQQRTMVYRAR